MINEDTGLDDNKPPQTKRLTRSQWKAITGAMQGNEFPDNATGPMSVAGVEGLVPREMMALILKRQADFPHDDPSSLNITEHAFKRLINERARIWHVVDLMPDDMPDDPPQPLSDEKPKRKRPSRKKGNK